MTGPFHHPVPDAHGSNQPMLGLAVAATRSMIFPFAEHGATTIRP